MKNKQSVFIKILLLIGVPVVVVFLLMAETGIYLLKKINLSSAQFTTIQNSIILVFVIGLIIVLAIIMIIAKSISIRVTRIENITNYITSGDVKPVLNEQIKNSNDQLNGIIITLVNIAKIMQKRTIEAEKIALWDAKLVIVPESENDLLGNNLLRIQNSISQFVDNTYERLEQINKEDYVTCLAVNPLSGDFNRITEKINRGIDVVNEKMDFFKAILDAIPFGFHVINNDMKWVYMNKPMEIAMVSIGKIKNRESVYGTDCCDSGTSLCNTENCGIKQLVDKGVEETIFEIAGVYLKMNTSYLKNKKEENLGFIEISLDLTQSMSVSAYSKVEVTRLEKNLRNLADGKMDLDLEIGEGNEYTTEVRDQFKMINNNFVDVKNSIDNLIAEVTMMTKAAIQGRMETRVETSHFKGAWKELIRGMNNILKGTEKPLSEVYNVVNDISNGNLNVTVSGTYEGRFEELKQMVNSMGVNIRASIAEITNVTGEIGNGNLNIAKVKAFDGDFNEIAISLNTITDTLNALLSDINDAADQVASGSSQVAVGSQTLAQGSTEQASAIQELTASVTEIANKTKSNAIDANKARELTIDVLNNAAKGDAQMIEMQNSMVEINRSSEDISKIIKVIDDIAFQTNILALNAAVEAARAGEHGKGFAVVSEEVRTLAARSADAAKETTCLISGSINKVKKGTEIADETAIALVEIVAGIEKVNNLVGNIAVASNEQATSIAQINTGIDQVAQVVQLNSATAEESAAASEELSSQAEILKSRINQFSLRK